VQDLTERNRAARQLRTSEARLRSVIASAPIVLTADDTDGRVAGVVSVAVDVTDLERVERERRHLLGQLITARRRSGAAWPATCTTAPSSH
jgi:PAS domain-containing protein